LPAISLLILAFLASHCQTLIKGLCQAGQTHLFNDWDVLGKCDSEKKAFIAQLMKLNSSYPGGIVKYCFTAQQLLSDAAKGINPLAGWTPEVPKGVSLEPGTPEYEAKEAVGLAELGSVGFVLVAGGLGERLGYSGIKIGLPCETTTGTTYIQLYCQQILAMQTRYCKPGQTLPLAIMVSDDTIKETEKLLASNSNFGLQVTIMKQEKVPSLQDSDARLALASKYVLDSKPHGHGDVHVLLHSTGTAQKWLQQGLKWVLFFQDTNALAFTTLPASLGVSVEMNLEVNSVTVPRYANQAVGAITKLNHTDGRSMTINVEYNQLDPLLRATINKEGDVNDAATGRSIFPGNINQLIFALEPYVQNLTITNGIMGEFVNAKYADSTKTAFKKPTRLECMMQDYPKVLTGNAAARVGFTQFPAWVCYSPCKNNAADAAAAVKAGIPASASWTSESDQYACHAQLLRNRGCKVEKCKELVKFLNIPAAPGPRVIIKPSTALFPGDLVAVFPEPDKVKISANSTLVVAGDVVIERLELDGALVLNAAPGTQLRVHAVGDVGRVANKGHVLVALAAEGEHSEVPRMRGFIIDKREEKVVDTSNICTQKQPADADASTDDGTGAATRNVYYFTGNAVVHQRHFDQQPSQSVCSSIFSFC